jgi:hypothetical protein
LGASALGYSYSVNYDPGTQYTISELTGYQTHEYDMVGVTVVAYFNNGTKESQLWRDYDGTGSSYGAFGSGWSLTEIGDTFGGTWTIKNNNNWGLTRFVIIGSTDLTLFDVIGTDYLTNGSFYGKAFTTSSTLNIAATYRNLIALQGDKPLGDLYERLDVTIDGGLYGSFDFIADTDNAVLGSPYEPSVPGPAALLPFGIGLLTLARRRK